MNSSGIIYQSPSFFKKALYTVLQGLGAGLIGFAVIGLLFTFGPVVEKEVGYILPSEELEVANNRFARLLDVAEADRVSRTQEETAELGIDSSYSLVIPKIDAKANVVANVDAGNKAEYLEALQNGVAHAAGTHFPGQGENIFLFSHSTDSPVNFVRFNAIFYLLGKLEKDDRVVVYFADKKYEYRVEDIIITEPEDISWINEKTGAERLVLQTCYPPGTVNKRLLVIAKPVSL